MRALDIADCINEACPWSGEPVQANTLTEYDGHVVGFCNPGCHGQVRKRSPLLRGGEGIASYPMTLHGGSRSLGYRIQTPIRRPVAGEPFRQRGVAHGLAPVCLRNDRSTRATPGANPIDRPTRQAASSLGCPCNLNGAFEW